METLIRHTYMIHFRNSRNNQCRTAVVPREGEEDAAVLDRAVGEAKNLDGGVKVIRSDGKIMFAKNTQGGVLVATDE